LRPVSPHGSAPVLVVATTACVLLGACPAGLAAQTPAPDPHAVQPQRPTVATHAGTVAPGWLEIEAGIEFDRYTRDSHGDIIPLLAKVGLARRLQLEVQTPIVRPPASDAAGVGDLSIGVKWRLIDDAPVLGRFAIVPSIKMPTGSADSGTGTGTVDVGLLFVSSHSLGPVAMDLNFGYTRRGGNGTNVPRNANGWTASFGGPARGRVGWVAELYGYLATTGPARADAIEAFLVGPTFEVRKWLVLDAGAIAPIAGPQPRAIYAGATYNVGQLWK
jgi:outer membrane putative beta-barrel porin/alpha-amylase